MTFDEWKKELAIELGRSFAMDGEEYILSTGAISVGRLRAEAEKAKGSVRKKSRWA